MALTSNLVDTMNLISLEDEEERGLDIVIGGEENIADANNNINVKLCIVGRFLVEGVIDFMAMKQTLAALWRPGKGVYIREIESNLYFFQFYH